MLQLIVMFILGVIFASCCWACVLVHSWNGIKDHTDDELQEMEKWYKDIKDHTDDELQEMARWYRENYDEEDQ